jgi:hypothetical protein
MLLLRSIIWLTWSLKTLADSPSACTIFSGEMFFNESRNTSLLLRGRTEGLGAEMQHLLHALSYAFYRGWNFNLLHDIAGRPHNSPWRLMLGLAGIRRQKLPHNMDTKVGMNFF